jgi:UDP-glucose:(heptosyl)LPS alpha-1,3-glucosyltransferase
MTFLKSSVESQSFDIIHTMGPLYLAPDITTAHICQKRLLRDMKTLFGDLSLLRKSYWAIRSRIASDFQRKSFKNAKAVIAVSSMLADELRKEYGIQETRVIYPGISQEFFDAFNPGKKQVIRDEMGIGKHHFVILFVGGQWERKGLKFLLESMKHLDDETVLLIAGGGDEGKYKKVARNHGIEEKVTFLGFRKEIVDCYLTADVVVLPSLYEPFGYPVLEGMAMGLPVIASRNVGAAEIITEGESGFVVETVHEAHSLSSAIEMVRERGADAFVEASRKKACEFLWKNQIQAIMALYEEVR